MPDITLSNKKDHENESFVVFLWNAEDGGDDTSCGSGQIILFSLLFFWVLLQACP